MRRLAFAAALAVGLAGWGGAGASAGDAAYGEYLAGECAACHHKRGRDDGIPSITGWDEVTFVAVMLSYRKGERENEAMQNVARSLDREQIEALAAYFASAGKEE